MHCTHIKITVGLLLSFHMAYNITFHYILILNLYCTITIIRINIWLVVKAQRIIKILILKLLALQLIARLHENQQFVIHWNESYTFKLIVHTQQFIQRDISISSLELILWRYVNIFISSVTNWSDIIHIDMIVISNLNLLFEKIEGLTCKTFSKFCYNYI